MWSREGPAEPFGRSAACGAIQPSRNVHDCSRLSQGMKTAKAASPPDEGRRLQPADCANGRAKPGRLDLRN